MAKITSRMSHELGEICEAMARVSSQANRASTWLGNDIRSRRCSCQLLSALHAILEQPVGTSLPPQTKDDPVPPPAGQALVLSLPFSSLQLNSSLVQYLELKPEQMSAITRVMANERPYVTPLMADLDAMRQKLARATQNAHPDQKPISSLALTQAQLLTKLVAENADLPS